MSTTGNLVLSALSVLGLTACTVTGTEEAFLGESQDALTRPTGTGFFGSDTLYSAICWFGIVPGLT